MIALRMNIWPDVVVTLLSPDYVVYPFLIFISTCIDLVEEVFPQLLY